MSGDGRRSHFIDLTPFRTSPAFARMWIGGAITGVGGQLTIVAVMLHVFALTESTFAVAMVAVFGLVPMILAGLYGGMLADAMDRRIVALSAACITWGSTIALAAVAWVGIETVWPLYLLTTINAAANTVVGTARQAIVPRLLPRELLPAAAALSGISMGLMVTLGPALAGVLVATAGFQWTYSIDAVLHIAAFLGLWTLPTILPEGERHRPGLRSLIDGWRFLRVAPNIRLQFVLDICAMTFGQPMALFPAIGVLVLGGGPITVGVLTASIAIGALASSVFSGRVGATRWHGIGIQRAITAYGACIALFGVVLLLAALGWGAPIELAEASTIAERHPNLLLIALACIALAASGAADNISAIFRSTMMQSAVPDEMRGRLQGLFMIVVTGGPRLGALYAGAMSTIAALWFPPLLGGLIIIALCALAVRLNPRFRRYDALHPVP